MSFHDRPVLLRAFAIGILVAAVGLSACGRRGALEPPPGAQATSSPDDDSSADREKAQKPNRPFILDGLL